MSKLIWKFRYAQHLVRRVGMDWRTAWYCAGCAAEHWAEDSPIDAAEDEISYMAQDAS